MKLTTPPVCVNVAATLLFASTKNRPGLMLSVPAVMRKSPPESVPTLKKSVPAPT